MEPPELDGQVRTAFVDIPHAKLIAVCLSDDCRARGVQQVDDGRVERGLEVLSHTYESQSLSRALERARRGEARRGIPGLTSKHSGRARSRHILGAYVVLDCYRHAIQWAF